MTDQENPYDSPEADKSMPEKPTDMSSAGGDSGMGKRLGVMLGGFLLCAAMIGGLMLYLDAQVPKGDPEFRREPVEDTTQPDNSKSAVPPAPKA